MEPAETSLVGDPGPPRPCRLIMPSERQGLLPLHLPLLLLTPSFLLAPPALTSPWSGELSWSIHAKPEEPWAVFEPTLQPLAGWHFFGEGRDWGPHSLTSSLKGPPETLAECIWPSASRDIPEDPSLYSRAAPHTSHPCQTGRAKLVRTSLAYLAVSTPGPCPCLESEPTGPCDCPFHFQIALIIRRLSSWAHCSMSFLLHTQHPRKAWPTEPTCKFNM